MKSIDKAKTLINEMLENNSNLEQVKKLGETLDTLEETEQDNTKLQQTYNELVIEYGKLIRSVGTEEAPKDVDSPKTLEEIIQESIKK